MQRFLALCMARKGHGALISQEAKRINLKWKKVVVCRTWELLDEGSRQTSPRAFCYICPKHFCKSSSERLGTDQELFPCPSHHCLHSPGFKLKHSTSVGFVLKQGLLTGMLTVRTYILLWCCCSGAGSAGLLRCGQHFQEPHRLSF